MAIVRRVPWVSQPQDAEYARVNPAIPAPSILFFGNAPQRQAADRAVVLNSCVLKSGEGGVGASFSSGGYASLTTNADKYLSTTGGSALVVMSRNGAAQAATAFAFGTYTISAYRFSAHIPYSDDLIYWDFGDATGPNRLSVASGIVQNRVHAFVLTAGAAGMRIYRDGQLIASSSTAVTRGNPTGCFFGVGIDPNNSGSVTSMADTAATYYQQAFWNNQLPDALALSLSANPWQLFAPLPRRIWVPAAGGSGGTAALTGSSVAASAGTLAPSSTIPLSGQAATASAGTLTPSVSAALSGQTAPASAGTVSTTVTIALTGTAVTASAGTVTYSAGNNISLTLTGAEVTASAGNLGLSSTVSVSGSAAAASAGTLTPGTSVAVSGTAVTASAGTVTYSANQDLTLALSGEAVQVSAGTITVIGGVSAVAVTSGAPGPRSQRWVVYINGKRYIGSLQEIEQIVAEFAEEQAEKAQTAKPPKKPKIKVEAGRVIGKTESTKPAQVAQQREQVVVQQQVKDIYAEAYARAIAQMELDEEEDIISLL